MGVARHRRLRVLGSALENRARERRERCIRLGARVADVEPEGSRDLIVPGAAGVDLPSDLAELGLDERVHVLGGGIDGVEAAECLAHLGELAVVEDPGSV